MTALRSTWSTASLLAAAIIGVVAVLPFILSAGRSPQPFAFEVELRTDAYGHAQVYYDVGRGLNERDSVRLPLAPKADFVPLHFPLAAGTYRHLRFDPVDGPAQVTFRRARIVTTDGGVVRELNADDFMAQNQVSALSAEGDLIHVTLTPPANDPNLLVRLAEPLVLSESAARAWRIARLGGLAAAVLLIPWLAAHLLPVSWRERFRAAGRRSGAWMKAGPHRTVLLVALFAVVASSYPVIFLGKSYVSPNFTDGTYLLYDRFPTLPDSDEIATEDARGADVGAIFWQFIPFSFLQHRALLQDGELPLWNRYNSSGTVLFAQGQSMFGDPLHLFVVLIGGGSWAWDLKYLLAKWVLCVGLGLVVLQATRHLPSAALAALSAAFLGFFVYRLNHSAYFSFCYAPWIVYAWLRIAGAGTWRSLAGWCGGLVLANAWVMHSGTIKEAYMLLLTLNLSGTLVLLFTARSWRERLARLGLAAWAGVVFVLLTAPSWLTFMDALAQAYTSYNSASAFQIRPAMLLGLFDEVFYRPLQRGERVSNPSANVLVLVGMLYFLAAFRQAAAWPVARALAWSALVPLSLAFGLVPPQWIVQLPFLANVAHIDNSFSCGLILLLVILAGFGWKAAFDRLGTPEGRHDLIRAGWGGFALLFLWISFTHTVHRPTFGTSEVVTLLHWGQHVPVSAFVWASLLVLPLAAGLLLLAARRALTAGHLDAAGAVVITACLALLLWRHGVHAPSVGPADYVFTPTERMDFDATSPALAVVQAEQREPGRVVGLRGNLFPGWSGVYGLEGMNGPDALVNPRYRELCESIGLRRIWDWRIYVAPETLAEMKPALDFLNVRHYVETPGDQPELRRQLTHVAREDLDVYRSEEAWPRAFFTSDVRTYATPPELGDWLRRGSGRPFAAIAAEDAAGHSTLAAPPSPDAARPVVAATDYAFTTNTTSFTVEADGPGLAVLHEAWLRDDFRATLNGEPVPYLRVNHAFKGVQIPEAGRYRIAFSYWPRRFTLALSLSAIGALLAVATAVVARLRFAERAVLRP